MKVSLNSVKQFTNVDMPIDELVSTINQRLGGVEEVTDFATRYSGAVIVRIETCHKHENADKLNVCMINDGSDTLTQVVCGAPNVREGMLVVWLKPGSMVPSTAGDTEPFVLGARELRGVMSNGMLASPKELGLGDSHDGILEISTDELGLNGEVVKPGDSFAQIFQLNDTIIDIENKMFTHRPDLFGQLGVAREIAGIQHAQFKSPDWYATASVDTLPVESEALELAVFNQAIEKVPRFMAVALNNIVVKPSPIWLQAELVRMGGKPINNVVDVTNYIMLVTAQPTHAYDYDKLRGGTLGARMAYAGETVHLLNGKSYEMTSDDIVIADGEGPVGLAGIMGGGDSEVSAETVSIVLEVANFDMYAVRKSSMRHGIFTDALTRFNKGQSPLQNAVILRRLVELIHDVAGGNVASETFDLAADFEYERTAVIAPSFINERLGLKLEQNEIERLLGNVEFEICAECNDSKHEQGMVHYGIPFWRTDIELAEDIVEEVGRLYGFENLPRELPQRSINATPVNPQTALNQDVRLRMSRAGANEVLTYSFVHEKLLLRAGQDASHAFKLSNALSPDLQYYRVGLTPSLLDKVHPNIKAGHGAFALFEIGKVHFKGEMDKAEPTVPNEDSHVGFVVAHKDAGDNDGAPYYEARRYLQEVIDQTNTTIVPMNTFDMTEDAWAQQLTAPYEPERSAVIIRESQVWGVVGEFRLQVQHTFKLPSRTAGFEIHVDALSIDNEQYRPLSRYPSVTQDVSIRAAGATYADVYAVVEGVVASLPSEISVSVVPTTIYNPGDSSETTTTFRLKVTSYDSTLASGEVRPIIEAIDRAAIEAFEGRVI